MRRLMRLAAACVALAVVVSSTWGCRRSQRPKVETIEEEGAPLASMVRTSDPRHAIQLIKGFYDIEQGGWRWTAGRFSVNIKVPAGAAKRGAVLELNFSLPEPVLARVKSTMLGAKVGSVTLEPETYTTTGSHTYSREVPVSALGGEVVAVEFSMDKFLAAGAVEQRELGVVVTTIELRLK